ASQAGIVAERSMYFTYSPTITGGHVSLGAAQAQTRWDFAEGNTRDFDTYYLLANPMPVAASVLLTFRTGGGAVKTATALVPAGGRVTVKANDVVPGSDEADATVQSQNAIPVVAERAVHYGHSRWNGGSATVGAPALSSTWYFAEGYTSSEYDSWVVVANPGDTSATGLLSLRRPAGTGTDVPIQIGPRSRAGFFVNKINGFDNTEFAASVAANVPVVAERATYFNVSSSFFDPGRLGTRVLSEGMNGLDVYETQRRMLQIGLDPGDLDGNFTDRMTQAAIALEKWMGLPRQGDVGPEEKAFLAAGNPPTPRITTGDRIEIDLS